MWQVILTPAARLGCPAQASIGSLRIAQKTDILFYRRVAKQNEPRRTDAAAAGKHHKTMNTQEQN
jgi:hypothetical protein